MPKFQISQLVAPNQAVEEEEAEQEMMIDMTNMNVITVMKEKKTQVDEGDVESWKELLNSCKYICPTKKTECSS